MEPWLKSLSWCVKGLLLPHFHTFFLESSGGRLSAPVFQEKERLKLNICFFHTEPMINSSAENELVEKLYLLIA